MFALFAFAAITQFLFWGAAGGSAFRTARHEPEQTDNTPAPVSVIVCFRNEAANIENCLARILAQRYAGTFELLAVDDNSTDHSADIVRRLAAEHPDKLRLLRPGPTRPGKKDALSFGILNARYEHLLLTDADCRPRSNDWLRLMTAPLRGGAEVALGVGEYAVGSGTVDHFQRFEAFYVAVKYLGFARHGLPYMGVGRNLAYRKSFFLRSGGFAEHTDLPGGDDDLLVSNNALPTGTACVTAGPARTVSSLSGSWSIFLRQRMRHQSVGFRYRPVHQALLGLLALSHGLFFLLGLFLLFTVWWKIALLIYALRLLLVYRAYKGAGFWGAGAGAGKVLRNDAPPVWALPVFDALLAPWYVVLGVLGALPAVRW